MTDRPKSSLQTFWMTTCADVQTLADMLQDFLDKYEIDTIHSMVMNGECLVVIAEGARTRVSNEKSITTQLREEAQTFDKTI